MDVKIIVSLGPSTKKPEDLFKMRDRGVDFVRINMSHSSLDDLEYFIGLSKKAGIPFIVDTEGSQIRNGKLEGGVIFFNENERVRLCASDDGEQVGNKTKIFIHPKEIIPQLRTGDVLYMDFDALVLRVLDDSSKADGYVESQVLSAGFLGGNKGVVVDSAFPTPYRLPALSPKDYKSIERALRENVGYIAASFMRSGDFVDEVRNATKGRMKIISKIECQDGLDHLDEIIAKSDFLLIDRGDLSKEVPLEEIPFLQKEIIAKCKKAGKGVFVATNLLETMVEKKKPTRAEVCDVVNAVLDGAYGLTLSAETAIGKNPIECINVLNALISRTQQTEKGMLVPPHGGKLVERIAANGMDDAHIQSLKKIEISENAAIDADQIATGVFSPLDGFMGKKDFQSVLDTMRLADGTIWPLPIILDVSREKADMLKENDDVVLTYNGNSMAILHLREKFSYDKSEAAFKVYGTNDLRHPGVRMMAALQPILLGGTITLLKRFPHEYGAYAMTPKQTRRIFKERHWLKIVGFHTRNVVHKSHEYIQLSALEQEGCDGLFVHPVVGRKKAGDYEPRYIIQSYEQMVREVYPENKVVFAAFNTYSRYAGPREALFTAICRKNFGCSHFIVGRDHAGVGNFYSSTASHDIFDRFPDLGIKPVKFGEVFYSKKLNAYVHSEESPDHDESDKAHISGTEARKMLCAGILPPEWFMRKEISELIIGALKRGEKVFV